MNRKQQVSITLAIALFLISFGGLFLHYKIHPLSRGAVFYIPFLVGLVTSFAVPLLFCFRKTLDLAYIINGFAVIIGTITMAQFSVQMFPDIAILWGKFLLGFAIFRLSSLKSDQDVIPGKRFFRYPNMGWWWVHLVMLALVYSLGKILWK